MQATPDDGQWKAPKRSKQFWQIHPPILTWNQYTHPEAWKDLNEIV